MIHCICNNINTETVDQAKSCGAKTPEQVQSFCGTEFNCGQCRESIQARLDVLIEAPAVLVAAE